MKDISQIDKNFAVKAEAETDGTRFYSPEEAPFRIYGVFKENGHFCRMPEAVAATVNEGVLALHTHTAGGRIRFITNSPSVSIRAKMFELSPASSHFAYTGSNGFDLYADGQYARTFVPPASMQDGYESTVSFPDRQMREILIHFPLYCRVSELQIGLAADAAVEEAPLYAGDKPIVYYGSSITQGGCAARPGMSYQAILSRRLNRDHVNLGFSGSAYAEDTITNYIKDLPMSLFVMDYDHNSPSAEHLQATHEKMFRTIREAQPQLPIIILSRPRHLLNEGDNLRRDIIETTYKNALAAGDTNVYFLDGPALTALCGAEGTVDNVHPTDFGFASMAKAIGDLIEEKRL